MKRPPLLLGKFTCHLSLELVRPATFTRQEESGTTYVIGRDYELSYRSVLRFADGDELPVTGKLFGELNQQVVIRDDRGRPTRISGYIQGRSEIYDAAGELIFQGRYYDSRASQPLIGDDALTRTGILIVDHWESGFGCDAYAGHAISLGGRLTRDSNASGGRPPLSGEVEGHID
jgi:hypothetical protein